MAAMIGPPTKATSIRTESADSGNRNDLRENAVDGVGMDKDNLEAEETSTGSGIDQLDSTSGEIGERNSDVSDFVGDVVDARPTLRKETTHRGVLTERGEKLDPAAPDENRCGLDALVGDDVTVLEDSAEKRSV